MEYVGGKKGRKWKTGREENMERSKVNVWSMGEVKEQKIWKIVVAENMGRRKGNG